MFLYNKIKKNKCFKDYKIFQTIIKYKYKLSKVSCKILDFFLFFVYNDMKNVNKIVMGFNAFFTFFCF